MGQISIRELESSDYPALAEFNSRFPGDTRTKENWRATFDHWWTNNPAYGEEWQRGFLLLDGNEIVGFVGSFPSLFKVGDEIVTAFNGTTWRVLKPYRQWSVDLWTQNRMVSKNYLSFNTTPTQDVIKMITKLKYNLTPWGDHKYSYLVASNAGLFPGTPGKRYRYAVALAASIYMFWQRIKLRLGGKDFEVSDSHTSDAEIDDLWLRAKDRYAYTNLRNAKSVKWYSMKRLMFSVYMNETLVALALYQIQEGRSTGAKELLMVDLWHDQNWDLKQVMGALIRHNKGYAKRRSIPLIKYPHFCAELSRLYHKIGLPAKKMELMSYVRTPNGSNWKLDSDNSFFTLLQGDFGV